ncbi:hypothetical protein GV828_00140 [Flavobacterium sp. NST-5]|uniref:Integral membrane protein n=1 Tax=Flavobacterium ichthyis TaxID=2698827 RepID=A0ABW9Z436_9FLAO|nr:hypothetical protein [Flavobacterium ichthyis]NBL63606.1 hypothetical protein [Flavobacterium ichthyis]
MNLNVVGYFIFLAISIYIILIVGKICFRNGNIFVMELIPDYQELCQQINKLLLVGYYLVNIGYCAMTLINWSKIETLLQLTEIIAIKTALIIGILGFLHYLNIFILTNYLQKFFK